jgi:hypothetical protein
MKKLLVASAVLWLGLSAQADTYVKAAWHYPERYHHGNIQPAYDVIQEWWFGKDKVTWIRQGFSNLEGYPITPALRVTLDKAAKRIIFAGAGGFLKDEDKYWVEIPLGAPPGDYLPPETVDLLASFSMDGKVLGPAPATEKETEAAFETEETLARGSQVIFSVHRRVATDPRPDFDSGLARVLGDWVRSHFGPSKSLEEQLGTVRGFVRRVSSVHQDRGEEIRADYSVLEVANREAPAEIYDPPRGYEKADRLTIDNLFDLIQALYGLSW